MLDFTAKQRQRDLTSKAIIQISSIIQEEKKNKLITYITVSLNNFFYYQYPHFYFYFLQIFCTNEVSSIQGDKRKLSFVKLVKRKKVAFGGDMVKVLFCFPSFFLLQHCLNSFFPPLIHLQ